jgi:hypothetical protein
LNRGPTDSPLEVSLSSLPLLSLLFSFLFCILLLTALLQVIQYRAFLDRMLAKEQCLLKRKDPRLVRKLRNIEILVRWLPDGTKFYVDQEGTFCEFSISFSFSRRLTSADVSSMLQDPADLVQVLDSEGPRILQLTYLSLSLSSMSFT